MPSPDQFRSVLPASIETPRLTLRLLTAEDAAAVHRYRGQPDVTRFLSHGVLTEEQTVERIRHSVELARVSTAEWFMVPWALVNNVTGQLIGDARTWNSNEMSGDGHIRPGTVAKDHALMGYVLDPDQHGKGLGREAAGALVTWLFAERNISSILAAVYEPNIPSRRLLESLGFVQDLLVPAAADRHGKNYASIRMRLDRPTR